MINFGFSAFLKLLSLSERRRRSEIRLRLARREGGYDFHRSLKRLCRLYANNTISLDQAFVMADAISRVPERRSTRSGIELYARWRGSSNEVAAFQNSVFESQARKFRLTFSVDFGQRINGRLSAVHIWNTANPALDVRMCQAALHLAGDGYIDADQRPQDLAVLNLRSQTLICLSEASLSLETAHDLASRIDQLISEVEIEIDGEQPQPEQRPNV